MSVKKLLAIGFIFIVASIAWMILGGANSSRSSSAYSSLKTQVATLYGDHLSFDAPRLYESTQEKIIARVEGKNIETTEEKRLYVELEKSDVHITIALDQRKKGNLWFPTFKASFKGAYEFVLPNYNAATASSHAYYFYAALNSSDSIYSNITMSVQGKPVDTIISLVKKTPVAVVPDADGRVRIAIAYDATGMEQVHYFISPDNDEIAKVNNFKLTMDTDFKDYDFPSGMLSPSRIQKNGDSTSLVWELHNSVTGKDIALTIPNKLNPGQIITRVSFFAPVSLLFFFVVLFVFSVVLKKNLHPMHYFFLAATFFSFHLMFSYFSDQLNIYVSFCIASLVSLALTASYLRLVSPGKLAFVYAPLTQFVYLIVFSFSFFFDGQTGLIVTICAVITLFILMQITGKIDWDNVFKREGNAIKPR